MGLAAAASAGGRRCPRHRCWGRLVVAAAGATPDVRANHGPNQTTACPCRIPSITRYRLAPFSSRRSLGHRWKHKRRRRTSPMRHAARRAGESMRTPVLTVLAVIPTPSTRLGWIHRGKTCLDQSSLNRRLNCPKKPPRLTHCPRRWTLVRYTRRPSLGFRPPARWGPHYWGGAGCVRSTGGSQSGPVACHGRPGPGLANDCIPATVGNNGRCPAAPLTKEHRHASHAHANTAAPLVC